jgi:hypothetical protein
MQSTTLPRKPGETLTDWMLRFLQDAQLRQRELQQERRSDMGRRIPNSHQEVHS